MEGDRLGAGRRGSLRRRRRQLLRREEHGQALDSGGHRLRQELPLAHEELST